MQNMGTLHIVPTPIGNLEDITLRAINVLRSADVILAEDTRTSKVLLQRYDISRPVYSHHKFNEHHTTAAIVRRLMEGENVALISDAGTPGISDPGFFIVREALRQGVAVECLPGATALIPALVASGLPADRFVFEGFLPQKKGRTSRLEALRDEKRTMIFYESPHRLVRLLEQLVAVFGPDRQASVARELTKIHETHHRGTLMELKEYFSARQPRGEIAVVVEGCGKNRKQEPANPSCEEQE